MALNIEFEIAMRPLLILSLLLPCVSFAVEDASYVGPADCRFLNDRPKEYERGTWSGACTDGYATGSVVLQWYRDGKPVGGYQGPLERGLAHGRGEYFLNDGSTYKGEFNQGRRSGPGVAFYAGLGTLSGNFDGDGVAGDADFVYLNEERFHGSWSAGHPNGHGTMYYPRGGSLTGEWHDRRPDGNFIITYPNGKQRQADFRVANEKNTQAPGLNMPTDKAYDKLTPQQQAGLRSGYVILQDDDEPPYPSSGSWPLMQFISDAMHQLRIGGEVSIDITVGEDGRAISARIIKSPLPDLGRYIVAELLKKNFKPAKCGGTPCQMVYPLRYILTIS